MKKIPFLIATLLLFISTTVFSKTVTVTPSGVDDSSQIQTALNSLVSGDIIQLNGSFILKNTIYLPSNITWILSGTITLATGGTFADIGWKGTVGGVAIDATKSTAIAEKNWNTTGATGIDMSGGTYNGNYVLDQNGKAIRMIQFARVTYSKFHDMIMKKASDDIFSLSTGCSYNECRNLLASYAGMPDMSYTGNGLNDKGDHNKWYDCIAEYCTSDAWTPKCRFSEFYRCIGRTSKGPGWGMYCRMDGSPTTQDVGEKIEGNKWFDCEASGNEKGGFAFDISVNSGFGAAIINNYIQAKCFNNEESGVKFRNKVSGAVCDNNEIDLLCYNNKGLNSTGNLVSTNGGLGTEEDTNAPVTKIYGSIVAYGNGYADVNVADATGCTITVYRPTSEAPPVLKQGSSNTMTVTNYTCPNGTKWCQQKYCRDISTIAVTGITVTPATATMASGSTQQLTPAISPSNATNKTVSWSSSNTAVATVSTSGLVTAAGGGTATITATTQDGAKTDTTAITVTIPVASVSLTPATATISLGNTQQLTATIAPSNATNNAVTWSTNNATVATVNASGLVTAVASGTATITVTTQDGAKTDTSVITIASASNVMQNLQAEDSTYSGAILATNQTGYKGTGFVDFVHDTGDYIQWTVNVPTAGTYELSFRYALPNGGRPLELKVNNTVKIASMDFPATGLWNTWLKVSTSQTLNTGNNTIQITSIVSNGGNIDMLSVSPYLDTCDALSTWDSGSANTLSYTTSDKKQGTSSIQMIGSATDEFKKVFSPAFNSGTTISNGTLSFWYFVSDVTKTGTVRVELGSGGVADVNELSWALTGLTSGWNQISLNFSDASQIGTPNLNALNWFRIYDTKSASITTRIDAIQVLNSATVASSQRIGKKETKVTEVMPSSEGKSIIIYPNPYKDGTLSLDILGFESSNEVQLKVTNLLGQVIHQEILTDKTHKELNLSGRLNESVYFISVESGAIKIIKKLIVK